MASPGQRRGTCGHIMALFDSHSKCVRCRDKGLGKDPCVEKKDCTICNNFTSAGHPYLQSQKRQKNSKKKIICAGGLPVPGIRDCWVSPGSVCEATKDTEVVRYVCCEEGLFMFQSVFLD